MTRYLDIQVLGTPTFVYGDNTIYIGSKKGTALIALLLFSQDATANREKIKNLLWGDVSEKRAQTSLRYTTWKVARALEAAGYTGFVSTRQTLSMDLNTVHIDAIEIVNSLQNSKLDEKTKNLGKLLDSFLWELGDISIEFSQWIDETKQKIRTAVKDSLSMLLESSGECSLKAHAELLVSIDPLSEPACRVIMSECASNDDVAGALVAYQNLCRAMDDSQGMEPSKATQDLAVQIKLGLPKDNLTANKPSLAQINVKPLIIIGEVDLSGLPKQSQFILSGFRHELIACLTRFREWKVCGANGQSEENRPNAENTYEIEFTAFEVFERFRLVVTLKEYSTDTFLWSEQFHTNSVAWLDNQSTIVRRLSMTLNVRLNTERLNRIKEKSDFPLAVYDQWLLAQDQFLKFNLKSWEAAKQTLIQLTKDHPKFARAYSTLSQLENSQHLHFPGVPMTPERRKKALEYAHKAIALDNMDSRNQLCLGWSYAMNGNYERGGLAFSLAQQINENDPWALVSAAMGLAFCGDTKKAADLAIQAEKLTPDPNTEHAAFQAAIAFLGEDYQKCVRFSELAGESHTDPLAWHAAALAHKGDIATARKVVRQFVALTRENWFSQLPANEKNIVEWIIGSFPIKEKRKKSLLLNGLSLAGLNPNSHNSN